MPHFKACLIIEKFNSLFARALLIFSPFPCDKINGMPKITESRGKGFLFRELHQNIFIGTASDRYSGWIGQDRKKRMAHGAWSIA
jgi:hypothetical protein